MTGIPLLRRAWLARPDEASGPTWFVRWDRDVMSLPQFKLLRPGTVEEAISLLGECSRHAGEAARAIRIVAGGPGLIPSLQPNPLQPQHLLGIRPIPELTWRRSPEER